MRVNSYILFVDPGKHFWQHERQRLKEKRPFPLVLMMKINVHDSPQNHDQIAIGCDRIPFHQEVVWQSTFASEYLPDFFPHMIAVSALDRSLPRRFMTHYHTHFSLPVQHMMIWRKRCESEVRGSL